MIVRPYYLDILKTYRDVPLVKILAGIPVSYTHLTLPTRDQV